MKEIVFEIILPLAFIAMTIVALHFWTLYLKYKKLYLEYKVKENQVMKDVFDSIIKGYLVKDEKGNNVTDKFTPQPTEEVLEIYREEKSNSVIFKNAK
jgi:hypothetical protein